MNLWILVALVPLLLPIPSLEAGGVKAPEWVQSYAVSLQHQIARALPPFEGGNPPSVLYVNLWIDAKGTVTRVQLLDMFQKETRNDEFSKHVSEHLSGIQLTTPKEKLPMPIRLKLKPKR